MDNERQIVPHPVRQEVKTFLSGALDLLKNEIPQVYDMEKEYAKSRNNHSWSAIFLIGSLIFVIGFGIWIASTMISRQMRNVSVDIETFDDLNLRNLLDLAFRVESVHSAALDQKAALEGMMQTELDTLAYNAETDRLMVRSLSLSPSQINTRIAGIDRKLAQDQRAARAKYDPQINDLDARIETYRAELATFDRARIEEAQRQQKVVNAELMRFELEKERMRTQYEEIIAGLRMQAGDTRQTDFQTRTENLDTLFETLDPLFSDPLGAEILGAAENLESAKPAEDRLTERERRLLTEEGLDPALLDREYQKIDYLASALLSIPWKNSAGPYVRALRDIPVQTFTEYEKGMAEIIARSRQREAVMARSLEATTNDADRLIAGYRTYFRAMVEKNGDPGYVIDPGRQDKMLVYIDPLYGTQFTDKRAFIFRTGAEYIGSVNISGENGVFWADVLELAPGKKIEPNDRILLNMVQ
jgi:hypothetical protein